MNIFEQNEDFYYIYYPAEKLEYFIFFDKIGGLDINDIEDENGPTTQMYPLGYFLSKWFLFYKMLNKNRLKEELQDDYINIFSKCFPASKVLNKNFDGNNAPALDMFLFFVVNNDMLFDDYIGDYQKSEYSAVVNIFSFINQCIRRKEYNTLDNLAKIKLSNDDLKELEYKTLYPSMRRKHKSYHNKTIDILKASQMTDLLKNNTIQFTEYHCYRVKSIKEYLYVALNVIFSSKSMIKKCNFCGQIFVPENYRSANYCRYGLIDGRKRNCYEQNKYDTIMYREKNNKHVLEEKRVRNRLHRWVEFFNGNDTEYKRRKDICKYWNQEIKEHRELCNQQIISEEEYCDFLTNIPQAKGLLNYKYPQNSDFEDK